MISRVFWVFCYRIGISRRHQLAFWLGDLVTRKKRPIMCWCCPVVRDGCATSSHPSDLRVLFFSSLISPWFQLVSISEAGEKELFYFVFCCARQLNFLKMLFSCYFSPHRVGVWGWGRTGILIRGFPGPIQVPASLWVALCAQFAQMTAILNFRGCQDSHTLLWEIKISESSVQKPISCFFPFYLCYC